MAISKHNSHTWTPQCAETSFDHMVGTIPYLAPETMALKDGTSKKPYNRKVDIWGLGLSAFELFRRGSISWRSIDKKIHDSTLSELERKESDPAMLPILRVIKQMLCWEAHDRFSADEVLSRLSTGNPDTASPDIGNREVKRFKGTDSMSSCSPRAYGATALEGLADGGLLDGGSAPSSRPKRGTAAPSKLIGKC